MRRDEYLLSLVMADKHTKRWKRTFFYGFMGFVSVFCAMTGCKQDGKTLYQNAMKYYRDGNYEKAAQLFETILEKYPDPNMDRKIHYELGNMYYSRLQQPENALKHFKEVYAGSEPGEYAREALTLIGEIYDKSLNDCLKGIDAYRALIRDYSSNIDAPKYQCMIAECLFKLNDYEQAKIEYETLVTKYPESEYVPQSRFQIANSYILTEQWGKAFAAYQALLQSPNLSNQLAANVKSELAFCYEHERQFPEALKLYNELQHVPDGVVMDNQLLLRKIERVQAEMKKQDRQPAEVDWKRRKK